MKQRRGVSLIEVMVALVLFGMIATVHTVATMRFGLSQRIAALGAARTAAAATATEMFAAMPRTEIVGQVGCQTIDGDSRYVHTRCISVETLTSTLTRVQIVITPSNAGLRPDTLFVDRVTATAGSVFQ